MALPCTESRRRCFCCFFGSACPGAEASFYSQYHKLFPVADEFANECLHRARPFSRTFYPSGGNAGEVESYSAYFQTLDTPSHFLLGCVLNSKHKVNFAGLFYSPRPLDVFNFAEYKISFIDPNDNVGLEIDGTQTTLLAVRQFVTDVIPPRLTGRPKNCEDAHIETIDGVDATATEHFRMIDESKIEYCIRAYCQTEGGGKIRALFAPCPHRLEASRQRNALVGALCFPTGDTLVA
jgi:hypothetical protein